MNHLFITSLDVSSPDVHQSLRLFYKYVSFRMGWYEDVRIQWVACTAEFILPSLRRKMTDTLTVFSFLADNIACIFIHETLLGCSCRPGDTTNLFKSSSSAGLLNNCWSTICISRTECPLKPRLWLLDSLSERVTPWRSSLIQHSAPWPSNKNVPKKEKKASV